MRRPGRWERPGGQDERAAGRARVRVCPLCGDPGWDYVNGVDDRDGMACRVSCGYTWTAADPGWRAQVLPGRSGVTFC